MRLVRLALAAVLVLAGCEGAADEREVEEAKPPSPGRPPDQYGPEFFLCPPGFEFAAYDVAFYSPDHPQAPGRRTKPDRCFASAEEARRAGYEPAPIRADVLAGTTVLYGVGVSTDPYGSSGPNGFGVATADSARELSVSEVRREGWGPSAVWLGDDGVLVTRPTGVRNPIAKERVVVPQWIRYRYEEGRLEEVGPLLLPVPVSAMEVSPDGTLVAYQAVRWTRDGYGEATVVFVQRVEGPEPFFWARGTLAGWSPDGRLAYWPDRRRRDRLLLVDLASSERELLLSEEAVTAFAEVPGSPAGTPRWSADGRYLALAAGVAWPRSSRSLSTIVVARADGTIIRLLTSPYIISMFAWSPVGHRLGWTTSGFPDPHQLFVLDGPRAEPRKVYVGGGHFDWITWSPDGNRILLDREDGLNLWLVLDPDRQERPVALPRLGGAPLWCCPPNAFASGVS